MMRPLERIVKHVTGLFDRRSAAVAPQTGPPVGREMPSLYYDEAFRSDQHFQIPFYKSAYYPTWLVVVDRLRRYGCDGVLDVGCGPGQFAQLVDDCGFARYTGLDFSPEAIRMARERVPRFSFRIGDVRQPESYEGIEFEGIVCMEVLEHLEEDLKVIGCFRPDVRCLMTVPNFPWRSHVRHFRSSDEVTARYAAFFKDFSVTRIKGVRGDAIQFYLLDGIRITPGERTAG